MSDIHLPLTESADSPTPSEQRVQHLTEAGIGAIVDDFYTACRGDALLGPIFEAHIRDWPAHLAVIRDFWSAALLKTRRYSGRPIEIHERITPALGPAHFAQWLKLWGEAVRRHATPHDARVAIEAAAAMARAMIERGYMRRGGAT